MTVYFFWIADRAFFLVLLRNLTFLNTLASYSGYLNSSNRWMDDNILNYQNKYYANHSFKHLPNCIMAILSSNCFHIDILNKTKSEYEFVLRNSDYRTSLSNDELTFVREKKEKYRKNKSGNKFWFAPHFNIGHKNWLFSGFYRILKEHFLSFNNLHKTFNKILCIWGGVLIPILLV